MIVVDASIFVKLLKDEDDSDKARVLTDTMLSRGSGYGAPSLAIYETLSAALHVQVPLRRVGDLFEEFRSLGVWIGEPSDMELALAEHIATTASPGGGFPALYDSIYHAMAIKRDGTLVTADERHARKTHQLGHVTLLADWRPD